MMSKVIKDTHASDRESMDMILSECLHAANEKTRHGGFAQAQMGTLASSTQSCHVTKMIVSMWMLCNHMLVDQQPSVCSHVTERRHVTHSYDGTVVNELDVLFFERPHLWLYPTKFRDIAGEHGLQWSGGSRLISFEKDKTASVKHNHAHTA